MLTPDKFTRWIDLMAALLGRNSPATFDELVPDVPEYARKRNEIAAASGPRRRTLEDSLKRTFERDKQELRTFGVPIEAHADNDGNANGAYALKRVNFYLPYLCVALPGTPAPAVNRVPSYGYRALATLKLLPDELAAIVDAATLVRSLGDPLLAAESRNAMRKLAIDLPVDAAHAAPVGGANAVVSAPPDSASPVVILPRAQAEADVFDALGDALHRRKVVSFVYHTFEANRIATRQVEPYGLFFLSGHWYLVGRDCSLGELRNFRLNRIDDAQVNKAKALSPDYEIPASFKLKEHAASRQAWELGDEDTTTVVVEFLGASGEVLAAAKLGQPVGGHPNHRQFAVRRIAPFVRWALSFGGDLRILSPETVAESFTSEVTATLAQYQNESHNHLAASIALAQRPAPLTGNVSTTHWQPKGAAAQLQRILQVIPRLADGQEHRIEDVARETGADVETLYRDLRSVGQRFDLPGGFVEGVQLYIGSEHVSAVSSHFQRPMRLTASELCALELGLVMLHAQRPPNEHAVLEQARARLREVIVQLPGDPLPGQSMFASIGDSGSVDALAVIRKALSTRLRVQLSYRKSGSSDSESREICPYALVASNGMLYVVAHCSRESAVRVFRMDRVDGAVALEKGFDRPTEFQLDDVIADGRVFQGEAPDTLVVHFSPEIARWIAEREGVEVDGDGSLTMAYPLADAAWAMRFVLQYGRDAEVLAPTSLRDMLRERLSRLAS